MAGHLEAVCATFQRRVQRKWGLKYLQGRLMIAAKYFTQPMARSLGEANVRCLQNIVESSPWEDQALREEHQRAVQETLGEVKGCVILDGTGFPRKGNTSVGVARQYCNQTGTIANCQVEGLATYASEKGYTLLDRRLYLPEIGFEEAVQARRLCCGVRQEVTFQRQLELAVDMLQGLVDWKGVTFRWVLGDEAFGRDSLLLDQITGLGKLNFLEVSQDTHVWRQRPDTKCPSGKGQGRPPYQRRLATEAPPSETVTQIAQSLPEGRWQHDP